MTSEYLLDAIGLIDDDLIQDAETRPKVAFLSSARRIADRWAPLAACLVLVFALGYGAAHLWTVGSDTTSASTSTGVGNMETQDSENAGSASASRPGQSQGDASTQDPAPLSGKGHLFLEAGNGVYTITGLTGQLPENCRSLGVLTAMPYPGSQPQYPAVDGEAWVGLELWAEGEDPLPGTLYIQQADGQYAVAVLVQP